MVDSGRTRVRGIPFLRASDLPTYRGFRLGMTLVDASPSREIEKQRNRDDDARLVPEKAGVVNRPNFQP